MRVAIVIPCRDRLPQLALSLRSIAISTASFGSASRGRHSFEIVVVNDRSTPGFAEALADAFPQVRVVPSVGVGPGAARNTAIESTQADAFLFTDSDCVVSIDWVQRAIEALGTGFAVVQGVPWLHQRRNSILGAYEERLYRHMFGTYVKGEQCLQTDTRNLAVTGAFLGSTGRRFPVSMEMAAAEARVFGQSLGEQGVAIGWAPQMCVLHEDPADLGVVWRQKYRHGSGRRHVWREQVQPEALFERYFLRPIADGVPARYVVPAHLAFLAGYCDAIACDQPWWSTLLESVERRFVGINTVQQLSRIARGVAVLRPLKSCLVADSHVLGKS